MTSKRRWVVAVGPVVAISTLCIVTTIGCGGSNSTNEQGGTTPSKASVLTNEDAVQHLAEVRCDREQRCGTVGSQKKYDDRNACIGTMKADARGGLNDKDCPGGINGQRLDACVDSIQKEACGNAIDSIQSWASCMTPRLCID